MSTRYDFVIFDLDGTLADTKADLAASTNYTLRKLGLPEHDPDTVASFVGGGLLLLLRRALGPMGDDPVLLEKAAEIFKPYYKNHMVDATRPYPGTMEMLQALRDAKVKMSVATNKPRMFTAGMVDTLFPGWFDPIIACGSSANDDAPRKPDPTCVTKCRARHPAIDAARILFVGDSLVDIETARNGGLEVASCTWGYGSPAELEAAQPRWLVRDNEALRRVVLGD